MKIVKLNRNFRINKVHGFAVGVKFDFYDDHCRRVVNACQDRFGNDSWGWKYTDKHIKEAWACGFGRRKPGSSTPYWIYLRDDSMLTMLILADELDC